MYLRSQLKIPDLFHAAQLIYRAYSEKVFQFKFFYCNLFIITRFNDQHNVLVDETPPVVGYFL